ncbi:hypothetical protein [Kitasatospora sp. NBC_01300]|uniref:hypothetical protein n=1 Tax=Kitasatospora sp. NBC_01300 TaxID=2903574 RepID=UPI00352D1C22|nr:hypothetical protein OG556_04485 [Kitasatospora sp. NBC_01300]
MRILLLGGTSFVGRAIADDALRSGAEVALFTRGRTNPGLFPAATHLIGDRDTGDYTALRDGRWDAVVDVSGYRPRQVGQAMDALGDRVGRYLFISSHAVYERSGLAPGSDESVPRRAPLRDAEQLTEETYGRLKVACEDDVTARYGDRATIVRPGKRCRGGRSSPSRWSTRATWPGWWSGCSRTTGRAPSTPSARPNRPRWAG